MPVSEIDKEVAGMSDYATALGDKLRAVRRQQGLTLRGVEQKSGGRWHAAAVGTYERGERAISVDKLADLLDFYSVPVADCFPESQTPSVPKPSAKTILNLKRLQQLSVNTTGPLIRFVTAIQNQRSNHDANHDSNVLSIRSEDLRTLSIMYEMTAEELNHHLHNQGVLLPHRPASP
jgi:transcriptional regulator with XRE-family HTH domain